MRNPDVAKYKRLFGITTTLVEFCPKELKRRWRVLCQKYHPDHKPHGNKDHFEFVQEAYAYLKKKCKGITKEEEVEEIESIHGIREIVVEGEKSTWCLWDIGDPDFRKQHEFYEKTGKRSVIIEKGKRYNGYY